MELDRELTLLQAVIEQIPVGITIVEAGTGRAVAANGETSRILGVADLSQASLFDLTEQQLYRPDGSRYAAEATPIHRSLVRGEDVNGEPAIVIRPDGTRIALEIDSRPVRTHEGGIVAAVAVFTDVTERERRTRTEREFVTNAAHELRTPLAAISSAVEVLQAGAKDVPEERDRFLDHIDRECGRLARLTTSLLSLARAQGGIEAPRLDLVELCPLLEQLAADARPAQAVVVEADCPADLVVVANRDLLEQALVNLVSNAARHTREGSIALAGRSDGERKVTVEIRDTGPGIADEERARVTERFYRGSDGDGFGLGLAIAEEAVRALGGELELESDLGRGTVARVVLPAARLVSA